MANTLTGLINNIYAGLNIVSREQVGMIMAVSRNSSMERAALDQTVRVPIAPATSLADNTPATNAPDTGDQTASYVDLTISRSKHAPIRWSGEEERSLKNSGTWDDYTTQQFAQAFRALCNAVEADLASLYKFSSRAYGTAGNTPFATAGDLSDIAQILKILDDNGAPPSDRHLVLTTAAAANIRGKQSGLFEVNRAGNDRLLRTGSLGDPLQGFMLHQSAQLTTHTKGTGTGYLINNVSGEAIAQTTLTLDTGSGTIIAGDILTHASDSTNKYVVKTALSGGDVIINEPGLIIAAANDDAVTVGANYRPSLAFHRGAFALGARLPARPESGDAAEDVMTVQDPISGLIFEVALYKQYRRVHIEVGLAWGYGSVAPRHAAILLG